MVPLLGALIGSERDADLKVITRWMDQAMFFAMNEFGLCLPGGALRRPCPASAVASSSAEPIWGRERPPLPPSCRGSGPENRGSLAPQMHVAFVRQNRALCLQSLSAPPVSSSVYT